MNTVLNFLKKVVLEITFGTIIKGAFYGGVVGICIAFVAYGLCDFYQLPYATSLLANTNFETIAMLYIHCLDYIMKSYLYHSYFLICLA